MLEVSNKWEWNFNQESALEIYCSANPLWYQALSRFLFLMYKYTPSNKNLARALVICGVYYFIANPNADSGFKGTSQNKK